MAKNDGENDFEDWMSLLRRGVVDDFLCHDQFPAWIEWASRQLIAREVRSLSADLAGAQDAARQVFRASQVEALARRLLLSRNAELLDSLRPLWVAFGTSGDVCDMVVTAVTSAASNWPIDDSSRFSEAHADFIASLCVVAEVDRGILGAAIRSSRIRAERRHVGFPVVVGRAVESNLAASVWIEPAPSSRKGERTPEVWSDVWQTVVRAVGESGASEQCPALPAWFQTFRNFAEKDGDAVGRLDSAGLSLAMQLLADQQRCSLPFGIGFTGRWDEHGTLQGVTDISLKLQAAAEAGIFLLFACRDSDQDKPEPQPVPGVRLALLQSGLSLPDVVRQVNRVCAESGLTEYRWRRESEKLKGTAYTSIGSRDLPDATSDGSCPKIFVGRDDALKQLGEWHRDSRKADGRRIHAVVGAGQTGKTTLLSKWANDLPFFPVWFSFRRGFEPRGRIQHVRQAIEAQIHARFAVVHLPDEREQGRVEDTFAATDAAVDIVVDGIDEAPTAEEQERILRSLQEIGGRGLLLIGSQPIDALRAVDHVRFNLGDDVRATERDASQFIESWAKKLDAEEHRAVAADLREGQWRQKLVKGSRGNLAVLDAVFKKARGGVWPSTPGELILAKEFNEYGELLLDHVKRANDFKPAIEDFEATLRECRADHRRAVHQIVGRLGRGRLDQIGQRGALRAIRPRRANRSSYFCHSGFATPDCQVARRDACRRSHTFDVAASAIAHGASRHIL